jgi:anti-sigma-K factor RskA
MSTSIMTNDRIVELLVQRATEGLSATEQAELKRLLADDNYTDADQIESAAAALMLAGLDDEPLPASLAARLQTQAHAFADTRPTATVTSLQPKTATSPAQRSSNNLAWFAAAACAVLALAGWWPRLQEQGTGMPTSAELAKDREELLAQESVLRREWKSTEDPAARGVTGDIVWDEQAQVGYMRFRGLPTNDPQQLQYQLWIFDASRGDQYPVDGGVFDIPATETGEVIIPILARVPVRDPAMFAVTIEKPGGAVVSSRERIVVVAPVT